MVKKVKEDSRQVHVGICKPCMKPCNAEPGLLEGGCGKSCMKPPSSAEPDFVAPGKGGRKSEDCIRLGILGVIEPQGVYALEAEEREWDEVEMAVDSGAGETVMNEACLKAVTTQEGAARRRGVKYEVANGETIENERGKKVLCGHGGWGDEKGGGPGM